LLGTVEFLGHTLRCDSRALVPRPETEQLCEQLLKSPAPQRVLDVGTGSGVIAISLALGWPAVQVEGVDVSEDALSLARENAERTGVTGRVKFYRSDLLAEVQGTVDLLVANLPYIATEEIAGLSPEVRRDPSLALDGGADGLRLIERLAAEAPRVLRGRLALEIGHGQAAVTSDLLRVRNFQDITASTDYQGRERFVFATYG
jgi:release factor glutamine methyltransferase